MDRNEALRIVKGQLPERRFKHTVGVMETAVALAKLYGADEKKAELAAIFHDYAKYRPREEMEKVILEENLHRDLLEHNIELWHAPVGAVLVEKETGISDEDILNSIRYHTTGRAGMTLLEKIIFLADYIEPGRNFPGVDEVRALARENLDLAMIKALANTISFLLEKKQLIYPDTIHTYNDLINKRRTNENE